MAQILPYSAILCHFRTFCKENLYLNRQPLCFHHFARPWPLTSVKFIKRDKDGNSKLSLTEFQGKKEKKAYRESSAGDSGLRSQPGHGCPWHAIADGRSGRIVSLPSDRAASSAVLAPPRTAW